MSSLMKAKNICEEHNLEFYSAILLMHTAYVQVRGTDACNYDEFATFPSRELMSRMR